MVCLVEEGTRQSLLPRFLVDLALSVLGANRYLVRATHILAEIRDTEAALALTVAAFRMNDFRIDEHQLRVGVLFESYIDHGDTASNADLGRGQSDAMCRIHGFEHVFDELLEFLVEDRNCLGWLLENRVAKFNNGIDHQWFL